MCAPTADAVRSRGEDFDDGCRRFAPALLAMGLLAMAFDAGGSPPVALAAEALCAVAFDAGGSPPWLPDEGKPSTSKERVRSAPVARANQPAVSVSRD